jgi:hypothetical protein
MLRENLFLQMRTYSPGVKRFMFLLSFGFERQQQRLDELRFYLVFGRT